MIASSLIVASVLALNPIGTYATETITDSVQTTDAVVNTAESDSTVDSTTGTAVSIAKSDFKISLNSGRIIRYNGTDTDVVVPRIINDVLITSIGSKAFRDNVKIKTVYIPRNVTSIGDEAFYGCSWLKSVTISDKVTSIGDESFFNCNRLTSVYIPSSVKSIGITAFQGCSNLKNITVGNINNEYASYDGVLFNKSKTEIIKYPEGKDNASYVIPNGVTIIDSSAFYKCNSLTSITIPNSITSIGDYVFQECTNSKFYVDSNNVKQLLINNGVDESKIILNA